MDSQGRSKDGGNARCVCDRAYKAIGGQGWALSAHTQGQRCAECALTGRVRYKVTLGGSHIASSMGVNRQRQLAV